MSVVSSAFDVGGLREMVNELQSEWNLVCNSEHIKTQRYKQLSPLRELGIQLCSMESDPVCTEKNALLELEYALSVGHFLNKVIEDKIQAVKAVSAQEQHRRLAEASLELEFEVIAWKYLSHSHAQTSRLVAGVERSIKVLSEALHAYKVFWERFMKSHWSHFASVRRPPEIMKPQLQCRE